MAAQPSAAAASFIGFQPVDGMGGDARPLAPLCTDVGAPGFRDRDAVRAWSGAADIRTLPDCVTLGAGQGAPELGPRAACSPGKRASDPGGGARGCSLVPSLRSEGRDASSDATASRYLRLKQSPS